MIDLLVFLLIAVVVLVLLGRRRVSRLGRGFGGGVREFRRARAGLPAADPGLEEDDHPDTA
jgi:Sec-independent protein translocase protein TatA